MNSSILTLIMSITQSKEENKITKTKKKKEKKIPLNTRKSCNVVKLKEGNESPFGFEIC